MKMNSYTCKINLSTLCERCAGLTKTCCRQSDVYVTLGDIQRISGAVQPGDFFEFRVSADPSYNDQEDDPVWASSIFRPDGSRRVVKHDSRGNCIFLGDAGCRLSIEIRPLICRLHPHLYNFKEIYSFISPECPVTLLETNERLEERIQGFDQARAVLWHKMLYDEIGREVKDHADRADL